MGNRDYKKFAPECYYHIYNRGVGKISIFKDDQDFRVFLDRLKENLFPDLESNNGVIKKVDYSRIHTPYVRKKLPSGSFSLVAYCLMPNHFHILIKQNNDIPISKLISKICTSYSKYFNLKYKRVGSLFQDQFKSVLVDDDAYLLWLSSYIHLNPQIAGLVKISQKWKWSSYMEYLDNNTESLCSKDIILGQYQNQQKYKKVVEDALVSILERKCTDFELPYAEFESP